MNTLQEILKRQGDEFDEKFPKIMKEHGVKSFPREAFYDLKFSLSTCQSELLEAIRERVGLKYKIYKNKIIKNWQNSGRDVVSSELEDKDYVDGYNQALQDTLSLLKEDI